MLDWLHNKPGTIKQYLDGYPDLHDAFVSALGAIVNIESQPSPSNSSEMPSYDKDVDGGWGCRGAADAQTSSSAPSRSPDWGSEIGYGDQYLLSLDGLERQEEAIVIQCRFALMELASKHRKYMNGKTGSKIGGKAYERMTNEYLGLMQTPSMQTSADEQSLANNQVVMSKWRETKEHIKDRVIVGQRYMMTFKSACPREMTVPVSCSRL